jgi:N-acyl-D-aspartate/D-glutamate deacylase
MFQMMLLAFAVAADPVKADVILHGGTVYDGSGKPGVIGDVAILGEKIVAVGKFDIAGTPRVVDCTGLFVTPGFIDLHTHSDTPLQQKTTRNCRNYTAQGVTTSVTGNCGSGPVDVAAFFKSLDKNGVGTNVIHQVPHNNVRSIVMGNVNRPPTAEELKTMESLVDKAMADGAWGFSTGLIYNPGTYAKTDELIVLAKVAAKHGGFYASHIRGEGATLLTAIEEALRIGREAGLPVHISHLKSSGRRYWGRAPDAIALMLKARESGMIVTADQYPYTASSTSLRATVIPTRYREGDQKELVARLDDPETGKKIRAAIAEDLKEMRGGADLRIARYAPKPAWQGKDLVAIAEQEKRTPLEIVVEIERNGGAQIVNFGMSDEDMRLIMKQPFVATASDGSAQVPGSTVPHPRSYGCFARKIGRFAIGEGLIPVEHAIRSASGLPADILRLSDRGYLKSDFMADVVVLDPKTYRDTATYDKPHQYATGVRWLWINGVEVINEGKPTGKMAGRVLRHR